MQEQTAISINKKRILPNVFGALVFVVLGIGMISIALLGEGAVGTKVLISLIGLVSLLFFGLILVVLLTKLVRNEAGLIITDDGLTDNTSGVSAGFIPWNDMRKINFSYTGNLVFLIVMVKKPEKYIERERNIIKRMAMRINYKISGSPIHILVSYLDIDLRTLNHMISDKKFQKTTGKG
jgi:hypothetical protein